METIESIYRRHCETDTAISPHLPFLASLASESVGCVEFGVKRGASSSALLMGGGPVVSFDVVETPQARELERVAGERWTYRLEDSRTADVPEADLFFLDSLHTFEQVDAELRAHADKARRFLVFHDVTTFGEVGAVGETGRQAWTYVPGKGSVPDEHRGIRPAIDALMVRDWTWRIRARYTHAHGLLVLERR